MQALERSPAFAGLAQVEGNSAPSFRDESGRASAPSERHDYNHALQAKKLNVSKTSGNQFAVQKVQKQFLNMASLLCKLHLPSN